MGELSAEDQADIQQLWTEYGEAFGRRDAGRMARVAYLDSADPRCMMASL